MVKNCKLYHFKRYAALFCIFDSSSQQALSIPLIILSFVLIGVLICQHMAAHQRKRELCSVKAGSGGDLGSPYCVLARFALSAVQGGTLVSVAYLLIFSFEFLLGDQFLQVFMQPNKETCLMQTNSFPTQIQFFVSMLVVQTIIQVNLF